MTELLAFAGTALGLLAALAAAGKFVAARLGIAASRIAALVLISVAVAAMYFYGFEIVAMAISLAGGIWWAVAYYRERSTGARIAIGIGVGLILLAVAGIVFLIYQVMLALMLAVFEAILEGFLENVKRDLGG